MKAFEKKWEENGGGICGKKACAKYWRAALEWFSKTMDEIEKHDISITGEEVINNELEVTPSET